MKALASFGVCLIAALAAGCTFDASQLRPLPDGAVESTAVPDAGASGGDATTASLPDSPIATGGSGGTTSRPDAPIATGGRGGTSSPPDAPIAAGGSGGTRGSSALGGRADARVPDAPGAQPGGSGGPIGGTTTGGTTTSGGTSGSGGASVDGGPPPPSCSGLATTCGPSGNESCCTSLLVPGGTFYRNYDGVTYTDKSDPATVSDFYLDKYEITVGRFRAFVSAGMGTQANPPAAGAGAHPLVAGSGWYSSWNASLSSNTSALRAAMKCNSTLQTWTDTPGNSENLPLNCMDWYTAFAFCAWEGARLPTEAEWNYAAAGGSEQREYPWGSGIDYTKASYDCMADGIPGCALTDIIAVGTKPAGNGRWGHADLAGNVWEWILDGDVTPLPTPCNNCANVTVAVNRVFRGGYFSDVASTLLSAHYYSYGPDFLQYSVGSRCARSSLFTGSGTGSVSGTGTGSGTGGGDAGVPDAPATQPDIPAGGSDGGADTAAATLRGVFQPTGNMTVSRWQHTATLLPNGKVLVAGGDSINGYLSNAELYDPATGTLTATGSMSVPRNGHTATSLPSGKVLIAGGHDASAELYDPATGTFTATGSMSVARWWHTATLLPNGKVLIAGVGGNDVPTPTDLYDPVAGTFATTSTMSVARAAHTATLLPTGLVLIAGGHDWVNGVNVASAELYDPAAGTFTATGSMSAARMSPTATLLSSGKVLVTGGTSDGAAALARAELYDPAAGTFTATGSMSVARWYNTATLLGGGDVLIAGGSIGSTSAELYDPSAGTFAATGSTTVARQMPTATLLPSGVVLIAGGTSTSDGSTALASAELYE